jgi:hypothetical protein
MLKKHPHLNHQHAAFFASVVALTGLTVLVFTFAASTPIALEPENGTLTSPAAQVTDAAASGGKSVAFKSATTVSTVKLMPFGDSIQAGDSNGPDVTLGYRDDLKKLLNNAGYQVQYVGQWFDGVYHHESLGGACIKGNPCNSAVLYPMTVSVLNTYKPDVIILNGGSNDFCCGRENQDERIVAQWMRDWLDLIFATKPDVYVIVYGSPPGYHDIFYNSIPQTVAAEAALGHHVQYISYDDVQLDGIHPNVQGYQTMANDLKPLLLPIFKTLTGH